MIISFSNLYPLYVWIVVVAMCLIYLWLPIAGHQTPTALLFAEWGFAFAESHWGWQLPVLPSLRSWKHKKKGKTISCHLPAKKSVHQIFINELTVTYLWAKALWRFSVFFLFQPMACCVSIFSLPNLNINKSTCWIGQIHIGKAIAVEKIWWTWLVLKVCVIT